MPSTLENSKFKQVNFILFITSFYIVSLMITSADKGKNEGILFLQVTICTIMALTLLSLMATYYELTVIRLKQD